MIRLMMVMMMMVLMRSNNVIVVSVLVMLMLRRLLLLLLLLLLGMVRRCSGDVNVPKRVVADSGFGAGFASAVVQSRRRLPVMVVMMLRMMMR